MTLLDRSRIDALVGGIAVLETQRLVLRAPRFADAKQVAALVNDRRIAENTARIPHPYTVDDAREWIGAVASQSASSYVITIAGEVLGACGVDLRDGVPFWGSGYATEAARRLVDHAFRDLRCEVLTASARVSNPASRRVLEKCGFQWTGVGL